MGFPAGEQEDNREKTCLGVKADESRKNVTSSFLEVSLHYRSSQEHHTARERRWKGPTRLMGTDPTVESTMVFFKLYLLYI